jgi:hypothetical protein
MTKAYVWDPSLFIDKEAGEDGFYKNHFNY